MKNIALSDLDKNNMEVLHNIICECKQVLYGMYTMSSGTLLNYEIEINEQHKCKDTLIHINNSIDYLNLSMNYFSNILTSDDKNKEFILKNSLDNINKLLSPILKNQNIFLDIDTSNCDIVFTNENKLIQLLLSSIYSILKDYTQLSCKKKKIIKISIKNKNNTMKILFNFEEKIENFKILIENINNIKNYYLRNNIEIILGKSNNKTILIIEIKN